MMEKLNLGLSLSAIGIGTVFLILLLLQLFMSGEAWLLTNRNTKTGDKDIASASPPPPVSNNATNEKLSPQVIAAIVGAIACQTGRPAQSFRLVSVRQVFDRQASAVWNFHGRSELISTRSSFHGKGGT